MVLKRIQEKLPINQLINISTNQQVQMDAPINYVISPFKWKINTINTTGLKLYPQATKEIGKESEKLDVLVSNTKGIIDHFICLAFKYGLG